MHPGNGMCGTLLLCHMRQLAIFTPNVYFCSPELLKCAILQVANI
jgi:hypothetical protein